MTNIAKLFVYIELNSVKLLQEKIKMIWSEDDVFFSPKGDTYIEFKGTEETERVRKNDYCNIRYEINQDSESLNDIILAFIKKQSENINVLTSICGDVNKKIHVCVYPESEQYTLNFSAELLNLLVDYKIEIGITVLNL